MAHTIRERISKVQQLRERTYDSSRPEAVAKQESKGKLTARERIKLLFDNGEYNELGILGHHQSESDLMEGIEGPLDGIVVGYGKVNGRNVCCASYDFTFLGGSMGTVNDAKMARIRKMALEYGIPLVFFTEGGGARVQERMGAKAAKGHDRFYDLAIMSGWVPIVTAVVGPSFAGHANLAGIADYVPAMSHASLGMAGPRLVEVATGEKIHMSELGGAKLHAGSTGMVDACFDSETELIHSIRSYLSYFPSNAGDLPPILNPKLDTLEMSDEVLDIIPSNPYSPYDMHRVIELVVDRNSTFELKEEFSKNIITSFARIAGYPVGIIANNPQVGAGALDTNGSDKMAHFISLCDAFNIPLVFLVDVPGYIVGTKSEHSGVVRHSMKPIYELGQATVPKFTVIVRKAYGLGYHVMGAAEFQPDLIVAWPCAEISPMGPEGAANIIYGKGVPDDSRERRSKPEIVHEFRRLCDPILAAQEMRIDDVIDPRETRSVLANGLEFSFGRKRFSRDFPPKKHGINPW